MVGLGAGGSSALAPRVGGGSRSISDDDSVLLIVVAVPMFSGRDFFWVGPGRGDDLELFFRDAVGVIEDCGFSE